MPRRSIARMRRPAPVAVLTGAFAILLLAAMWVALTAPALAASTPPPDTINDFLPEQRNLGDCLGALQRPGCGSEARGGWRQGLVFVAMLLGLVVVAGRIVRSTRRLRRQVEAKP